MRLPRAAGLPRMAARGSTKQGVRMTGTMTLRRRLLVTACAATGTTERGVARWGAGAFLPALFVKRYANMGGLDEARFAAELDGCRTFEDARWCAYWDGIAREHADAAERRLMEVAPEDAAGLADALWGDAGLHLDWLATALAPHAELLAEHRLVVPRAALAEFAERQAAVTPTGATSTGDATPAPDHAAPITAAVHELLQAITYLQVSAFPGTSDGRMAAYRRSRRLFDALAAAFAGGLRGTVVEPVSIPAGGEVVRGYLCLPAQDEPCPLVVVTNGLEGTVQELLVPLLRYRASGLGVLVMEMPGAYAYAARMSAASEAVYRGVVDAVAADPRVDAGRLGIVGVSFGGYWAARMAMVEPRFTCAVACGAPTHRSFRPKLGLPEIILDALAHVTGATTPPGLLRRLRALSLAGRYGEIRQPLLVINGANDTLLSTQDSIDLAAGAPLGELRLYAGDDHCAMGHYDEWLDVTLEWLTRQLRVGG